METEDSLQSEQEEPWQILSQEKEKLLYYTRAQGSLDKTITVKDILKWRALSHWPLIIFPLMFTGHFAVASFWTVHMTP